MFRAMVVALAAAPLHLDRIPLPRAVLAEETRYARSARRNFRDGPRNPHQGLGRFWVERTPRLISATTRAVSTLMPFLELYPAGHDGSLLGYVAGPPCGRVYTVVPYAALRPFLSPLGATLMPPTTAG